MPVLIGPISLALANLQTLLANAPAWQTWTGTANATDATAKIHLVDLPAPENAGGYLADELAQLRPFAKIDLFAPEHGFGEEPFTFRRVSNFSYRDAGKLTLDFVDSVPDELLNDFPASKIKFLNDVGSAIVDMLKLAGTDGYLSVAAIELYQGPVRVDLAKDTQGDFWRAQFIVHYP